jgi:predicted Fe-S protein YdhL (DUF1289 family)
MALAAESPDEAAPVASPCTGICALDRNDVCQGCGRTLAEIASWAAAPPDLQRTIAAAAAARRAG